MSTNSTPVQIDEDTIAALTVVDLEVELEDRRREQATDMAVAAFQLGYDIGSRIGARGELTS